MWSPAFVNITIKLMTGGGLNFRNEGTNLFAIMARFNALFTPSVYIWGESGSERSRDKDCVGESVP